MTLRNQPPEAYELLDQRDEEQILDEIKGNIITEMFYSFKIGGKEVTGVSWVGTKEIARQYGNVRMEFVDLKDMGTEYMAIVRATDTRTGTGMLGTSIQSKQMEIHDLDGAGKWLKDEVGKYVTHLEPDKFASTKAISKAQRNAIRAIIPERFLIEMYEQFKRGGKPQPGPRKQVPATAKPVEPKNGTITNEAQPKDPARDTVAATLEVNGLHAADLDITKHEGTIRVEPRESFPMEMFGEYDGILRLMGAVWLKDGNRWEIPTREAETSDQHRKM